MVWRAPAVFLVGAGGGSGGVGGRARALHQKQSAVYQYSLQRLRWCGSGLGPLVGAEMEGLAGAKQMGSNLALYLVQCRSADAQD